MVRAAQGAIPWAVFLLPDKDSKMTTQNEQEAEVSQETPTEETVTTEETQEEVDWTVRGPEIQAELDKAQNNLRALQGQDRRQSSANDRLDRIEDSVAAISQSNAKYMAAMARGDMESLPGELAAIEQETQRNRAARSFEGTYEQLREGLLEIVQGEGEDLLISAEDSTKLLAQWNDAAKKAQESGDLSGLYQTHIAAERMKMEQARKTHATELRKEKEASKTREKKALENAGVYDQDTGPITSGAGGEELTSVQKMSRALDGGKSSIQM